MYDPESCKNSFHHDRKLAELDSKKDIKENTCVGNKCSKNKQNKKTVKIQPVASGKGKGRSGVKDVAGGKKNSKSVKKS